MDLLRFLLHFSTGVGVIQLQNFASIRNQHKMEIIDLKFQMFYVCELGFSWVIVDYVTEVGKSAIFSIANL